MVSNFKIKNLIMTIQETLQKPYSLEPEQVEFFRQNRFIKLKQVFPPIVLEHYSRVIKEQVRAQNTMHLPMEERSTYDRAFLQVMNIWTKSPEVKEFVFGKRLARIATELMGTRGVRLYHDQALFKEPGGGYTPWHADQYYWPLSNDNTITAWIPLQGTPLEMGPLEFSSRSHLLQNGRTYKISDDSEKVIGEALNSGEFEKVVEPFDLGEVSFHAGWLFHRAGPNRSNQMRAVMTIIYMDSEMRLKQPENDNQQNDWDTWCPGATIGDVINTPLNPVLYQE